MHYYYLKVILSSDFPCSTLELMYYFHHIMSRVHVFASFITVDFYYLSTVDSVGFSIVKWPSIPPPFPSVAFWGKAGAMREITLPIKVRLVKAMVFPVVMYGCESWTVKKAERQRIDDFELWCLHMFKLKLHMLNMYSSLLQ